METKQDVREVISELNETFKEDGFYFVYETNDWYECIRFNQHVLWDSEDCRSEWNEETNEYEPLLGCIQKRFNEYINILKKSRFNIPNTETANSGSIVEAIFEELDSRKGFDMNQFDDDIQDEIYQACVSAVEKNT